MIATEQKIDCNFDDFSAVLAHLDEFGLSPNQFRVYCHLFKNAMDGIVSESSESIAKVCKLTRITVLRVLSQLAQMNLIHCDRAPGKKTVYKLMPFSNWRRPVSEQKETIAKVQSKVIQLRGNDTCKPNLPVNEINTQQAREEYPMGYSSLAPATEAVNEIDTSNSDTDNLNEKLAAARARGWWDAGTWQNDLGEQMVSVNRFMVSVAEFMQRSLDSFDVGRQMCAEGLRKCKEQIEKIKRRSQQQRIVAIAAVGNELEQGFCYG